MIGALANGATFVRNFIGPCLWVALAGYIAGGASGGWLAWKLQDARVARAETTTLTLQRDIAAATAATELLARQRTSAAEAALRERDQSITAAVDAIPARVAAVLGPMRAELRSLINDPAYNCLRTVPLPEPYLNRLRRPAGSAAAPAD